LQCKSEFQTARSLYNTSTAGRTCPCRSHFPRSALFFGSLLRHGERPLARAILQRVGSRAVPGVGQKLLNRMELSNRSSGCIPFPEGARAMNPPDEFLKHAADCEQMAKFARDAESKATWNRMAERWRRCAEKFTTESLAAHHAMMAKRRQGVAPDLAHH
jgi:hypothetical protein